MKIDKAMDAIEVAVAALDAECRRSPDVAICVLEQLRARATREALALYRVICDRAEAQHGRHRLDVRS